MNTDNRYYAYLPSTSRNSSSNSTNRNAHYQYYDSRLRSRQQTLYEYQLSNRSPNRSTYVSTSHQYSYQPPSFLQESSSTPANVIADLGEPISIFDDIKPLEYRRPMVALPLPSTYIPPDPTQRASASDVRLATAHALREQLLTDIERSISDIDRELTSLERRPSIPRYIPPRFSPIKELDVRDFSCIALFCFFFNRILSIFQNQDENLFRKTRQPTKTVNAALRQPIPSINSPSYQQIQQASTHSTSRERHSGSSKIWPNKPKRVYEVIPSLTSDSRKTSRQSSVGAQHEQVKISEIQSPQSRIKTGDKRK